MQVVQVVHCVRKEVEMTKGERCQLVYSKIAHCGRNDSAPSWVCCVPEGRLHARGAVLKGVFLCRDG